MRSKCKANNNSCTMLLLLCLVLSGIGAYSGRTVKTNDHQAEPTPTQPSSNPLEGPNPNVPVCTESCCPCP